MSGAKQKKSFETIFIMIFFVFLSKLLGLIRSSQIASIYGTSSDADVIAAASKLPFLLFDMTLGIMVFTIFIPVFNKRMGQNNKKEAFKFASNFMTIIIILSTILSVFGIIFSKQIIGIMVPNFDYQKQIRAAKIFSILSPSIIFTSISYMFAAILQSFGNFLVPSAMSVVSNLFMILYLIIFGKKYGLTGIAASMFIGWCLQFFVQIPWVNKTCFKYIFYINLRDPGIEEAFKMSYSVLISSWAQPICFILNMYFGSKMGIGAISSLDLATNIYLIVFGIFSYSVSNFMFPKISRLNFEYKKEEFSKTVSEFMSFIIYIISFVSSIFFSYSFDIIKIIYGRGSFDESSIRSTSTLLFYLTFGMIGSGVNEILCKSFYAIENAEIPMFSSLLGVIVNFLFSLVLIKYVKLGCNGLAISNTLCIIVSALFLIIFFEKKIKFFDNKKLFFNIKNIFFSLIATVFFSKFFYFMIDKNFKNIFIFLKIFISSIFGLFVYLSFSALLKIYEFELLKKFFMEKKLICKRVQKHT